MSIRASERQSNCQLKAGYARGLLFCFIWTLLALVLTGCKDQRSSNQLIVGTAADYPPFEFYQNSKITGFEIELVQKIAAALHKECIINDLPFESLIAALYTKRIDIAASGFSATPVRAQQVDFSVPYHESSTVMIVNKDTVFASPQDLKGQVVGVQLGTVYENQVKADWASKVEGLQVRSLSKIPDLLQDLKVGRIAAIMMGNGEARAILTAVNTLKAVQVTGENTVYALALPKGSPLLEQVNHLINQWLSDGTLQALKKKWLL